MRLAWRPVQDIVQKGPVKHGHSSHPHSDQAHDSHPAGSPLVGTERRWLGLAHSPALPAPPTFLSTAGPLFATRQERLATVAKFKINDKALKDLEKQIINDVNKQQHRNPVLEGDSQSVKDRKIAKWIKDAGYGKK